MKKKFAGMLCILTLTLALSQSPVYSVDTAVFSKYFDAAQSYYNQGQFSSAIVEYRKALRINYLDNSARIGLINSYLSRAAYYANQEKRYENAANDFRSAIFYLKMFPQKEQAIQNSSAMITSANENLNQCLTVTGFDRTASSRYKKAEELRALGNLSAASYEFSKAAENSKLAADSYTQIAELMKVLGNEPRSAEYFKLALDLNPNDGLLRMKYARTLDKIGQYEDALPQYNAALANSKGDMEVLYSLERIYLKKLAQTPSDAELNANIGAIKQAQGDFDSALAYYSKAEQLNPENITTRLNVGTLYQQKKDYQKAIKSYDSVITLYPDNVQANLYKAKALNEMGDSQNALALYKKVLSLDPANQVAKTEIIDVMQKAMSSDEFISYLEKNANGNSSMQNLLYEYTYKLHKENKLADAIKGYRAYININQTNPDVYVNLAICYAAINDYTSAKNILNTAKNKFPSNNLIAKTLKEVEDDYSSQVISNAATNYENKDYKQALNMYLSITPATEESLIGAAVSYQSMENYEKAIEYYKKAFLINPKNAQIPYYIGYLYSEKQNWIEAEKYLRQSVAINPNSEAKNLMSYVEQNISASSLNDGIKLFESGNYENALTKFNEILKKETNNGFAYYYRAMIYDEQKKPQLAIKDYLNVLKYSKDISIANYLLATDYDGLENYNEAYKYYNLFISNYSTDDEYLKYAKTRAEELKPFVTGS